MSFITLRSGRKVGDYLSPYIIAELNTSHFGDLEIAKKMIEQAKQVGCDCVKFQSWSAETLYSESYYKQNPISKRMIAKFSLEENDLLALSEYSSSIGVDFASTPYSVKEAKFLVDKCNVPFIKVASMELNHLSYLTEIAGLNVPIILSTGMGTLEEIYQAVEAIRRGGNDDIVILHCISVYPAPVEAIRLQNILGLRSEFPMHPIGYSDHSDGTDIAVASVALGACIIEKHFTLDSSRIGMDNQMATEPDDLRRMIKSCHRAYRAMGGAGRLLSQAEKDQARKMRRSMTAKVSLKAGQVLVEDDVEFMRPGDGISPDNYFSFIGRVLNQDIAAGSILSPENFFVDTE
jgi:N-acetylneuraminate synthase